ncbi:MAG: FtsW/RodA/SpoVE family cell cycle protein [Ardenticatenaceae bacterium]|nr:FtsW/RodA/SpoVE family cell cycle protein [Ardenticatenaceae bacterium]
MQTKSSVWRYFDIWLAAAVVLLSAFGVLMIRSAITGEPNFVGYDLRQAIFLGIGIVVMLIVASIDYRYFTSAHWAVYTLFVLSLVLVLLLGAINNAAQRWIPLGPIDVQPSELGRTFLTVSFAQFLALRRREIKDFRNTLITIGYFGLPILLIFIQPDLGMSILYVVMWFVIIVMAGLPLTHFLVLAASGAAGLVAIIPFLQSYQLNRITTFIDPASDPEQAFNVDQAIISVGSGGWFGKGYMQGTQSQLGFLRVQHTDFIFSMITEEMGFFFGSLIVLGLLSFILFRILNIANLTTDPAGQYICIGIAGSLFFQIVVSVGMNIRLLPVTGLTLPFVSYGGSSLVTLFLAIGVVQSVRMRHRKQEFG